jgi:succinate dehydrogenase/fumarate reductase flavoprotein subunit
MSGKHEKWDLETEVLVVGTGGAALTAAILAYDNSAKVAVIERSDKVGGTTAVSGGGLYTPLNSHMAEKGYSDSREEVLKYCKTLVRGRSPDEIVETFVDTASEMLKYMEEHTPAKFECTEIPDYHADIEGAKIGRTVGPLLFNINELGESAKNLRRSPLDFIPLTYTEMKEWEAFQKPQQIPLELVAKRKKEGLVGLGEALIAAFYKACLDRGIKPILKTRALKLLMEGGQVIGLSAQQDGKDWYARARKAVILACGGFEWNDELKTAFLPGEVPYPSSPPFNEGDGLKMAMEVGAQLGNMSECWGWPVSVFPGEEYEGRTLSRGSAAERSLPHTIIVNRYAKRFVNEAGSYNILHKWMWAVDINTAEDVNLPAWHILDDQYHEKYAFSGLMPGKPFPPWVIQGNTVEELAQKVGIDPEALKETVTRFNKFALEGEDLDFHRGRGLLDQYWGDKLNKPNPSLGTIEKPPFYAIPCHVGCFGTKGGPRTNTKGQVLHVSGKPIPGLYAAGNVRAGVSGPIYWGGGCTIGPAVTFGYICGINAAKENSSGGENT